MAEKGRGARGFDEVAGVLAADLSELEARTEGVEMALIELKNSIDGLRTTLRWHNVIGATLVAFMGTAFWWFTEKAYAMHASVANVEGTRLPTVSTPWVTSNGCSSMTQLAPS